MCVIPPKKLLCSCILFNILEQESYSLFMFLQRLLFILVGVFCFSCHVLFAESANSYFLYDQKNLGISLDTRDKNGVAQFSFEEYDIPAPPVCKQENTVCHEKMTIKAHVEKEWEVVIVSPIWSKELTPQKFSEYYPNLPENKIITDGSSPQNKWIVQRILYERGLLDTFPTGKIGYKTEEAIAKFQYLKGIEEVDKKKKIIVIGPKTIKELNKLKEKMKDPSFISRLPLPATPTDKMTPFQQQRIAEIRKILVNEEKTGKTKNIETTSQKLPHFPQTLNGDRLKFFGEAKIQSGISQ